MFVFMRQGGVFMTENGSQDGLDRLGFLTTSDSHISDLRIVNDELKGAGAYLTEKGLHDVLAARQNTLARQARLQWSLEMTEKILERAAASPYAEQDTLPQVIADWFEVILYIQNQTTDFLADDDVVFAVAEYFDNYCGGDADLLRGKAADRILKNFKMKKELSRGAYDTPGRQNSFDDEEEAVEPEDTPLPVNETFRRNVFAVRRPANTSPYDNAAGEILHDSSSVADSAADSGRQLRRKSNSPDEEAHEILALFHKELSHYVGEGASSVSERTGRNIFASIRYTLSLAANPSMSVEQRFYEGQKKLLALLEESERDLRTVIAARIHIPLETYYGTLTREIPSFFRLYDAQYGAHETPGLLDYPLAIELENTSGIIYIREYLHRIRIETEYALRLTDEFCSELLFAYGRKYDMDIRPVPVNLFEVMMSQAFAAALVRDAQGKSIEGIWGDSEQKPAVEEWLLSPLDYAPALILLASLPADAQRAKLERICRSTCAFPGASGPEVIEYALEFAARWISHFLSAVENHCPENLILFLPQNEASENDGEPSYFIQDEPMPDEEYAELVEKLNAAEDAQLQNQLIRANVHSRKDLLDILNEDFWMTGEKEAFLKTFSPEEQALFAREAAPPEPELGKR